MNVSLLEFFPLDYVKRVDSFLSKALFPRVKPLLYENGGPIIMVQVGNIYERGFNFL